MMDECILTHSAIIKRGGTINDGLFCHIHEYESLISPINREACEMNSAKLQHRVKLGALQAFN